MTCRQSSSMVWTLSGEPLTTMTRRGFNCCTSFNTDSPSLRPEQKDKSLSSSSLDNIKRNPNSLHVYHLFIRKLKQEKIANYGYFARFKLWIKINQNFFLLKVKIITFPLNNFLKSDAMKKMLIGSANLQKYEETEAKIVQTFEV